MRAVVSGLAIALMIGGAASAQGIHTVRGYVKSDGTYVAPAHRTNPNTTRNDNWSTRPNVNPYTGNTGTKAPDSVYKAPKSPKASKAW